MLERLKWGEISSSGTILCEYQLFLQLDEYEQEDIGNFKQIYCIQEDELHKISPVIHELIKNRKITYLAFCEDKPGNELRKWTEYRHPNYAEIFRRESMYGYSEEITPKKYAKLLFEIDNGNYDFDGNYIGYDGYYADFKGE
jgi:hypothetical protein